MMMEKECLRAMLSAAETSNGVVSILRLTGVVDARVGAAIREDQEQQ